MFRYWVNCDVNLSVSFVDDRRGLKVIFYCCKFLYINTSQHKGEQRSFSADSLSRRSEKRK